MIAPNIKQNIITAPFYFISISLHYCLSVTGIIVELIPEIIPIPSLDINKIVRLETV